MKNKKVIYIGVGLVTAALAGTLLFGQLSSDDSAGKLRSTVKPATTSIKVTPQSSTSSVPSMQVAPATNNSNSSAPAEESNSTNENDRLACLDSCSDSYNSCLGDTSGLSTEAFNAVEAGCSSEQTSCRNGCNS